MAKYLLAWILLSLCGVCLTKESACPNQCKCTSDLTIVRCWNQNGYNLPTFPSQVRELYLSKNNLGPVLEASIGDLTHLEVLDISYNAISWIYPYVFTNLTSLRTLNLRGNTLTETATGYLNPVKHVQNLDLSQNNFRKLPSKQLYWYQNLTSLNVSYNLLSTPRLGNKLHLLKNISVIDFSGNSFANISRETFSVSSYWTQRIPKYVNFSYCNIVTIEDGVFAQLPALHELNLGGNSNLSTNTLKEVLSDLEETNIKILKLPSLYLSDISNLFHDVHRIALDELDLSENNLVNIPESALNNLMAMKRLMISKNSLVQLGGITNLGNLRHLDVSHNAIEIIRANIGESLHNLEVLDISHNNLLGEDNDFSRFQKLIELNVGYNKLTALKLPTAIESLKYLKSPSNRISALPPLNRLRNLQYLDISGNWLTSLGPFIFPTINIRVANFSGNRIRGPLDNRIFLPRTPAIIDLSNNYLEKVNHCGWKNVRELYLHGNKIRTVDYQSFYAMYELKVLTLANNQLTDIPENTFNYLINMTSLDLSGNQFDNSETFVELLHPLGSLKHLSLKKNNLTGLGINTFEGCANLETLDLSHNTLHFLDPNIFKENEYLQSVDLSHNWFVCDCDLVQMRDWILSTRVTLKNRLYGGADTYICMAPEQQKGKSIGNFTVDEVECNPNLRYMMVFSSVAGVIVFVAIVSTSVCYFYCKFRQKYKRKMMCLNSKHDTFPKVHGDQIRLPVKKALPDGDVSYHTLPLSNSKSSLSKSNLRSANNKSSSTDPMNVLFSSKEVRFFRRSSGNMAHDSNTRNPDNPVYKQPTKYPRTEACGRFDGAGEMNSHQSKPPMGFSDETRDKQYKYYSLPVSHQKIKGGGQGRYYTPREFLNNNVETHPKTGEFHEQYKYPYRYDAPNGEPRSRERYALLNYTPTRINSRLSFEDFQERNRWQSLDRYGSYSGDHHSKDRSYIPGYRRGDNRSLLDLQRTDAEYIMNDKRQMRGSTSMGHLPSRCDVIRSDKTSGRDILNKTGWL